MSEDSDKKVIGYRQAIVCISERRVRKAYLADDVEDKIKNELITLLDGNGIEYEMVASKRELGRQYGIKVSASIVCLLN